MSKWHKIAQISDLKPGEGKTVNIFGKDIALFHKEDGSFKAIDNCCPHKGASLGEGTLKENCVICPWHQWTFDLDSGKNIRNEQVCLNIYPVKVEGENVFVEV